MIVGLYIKVQEQYDASIELVVDSFKERVEGDGGTFEAGTCLQNTIESLGGPTPVVAYRNVFKRIELFEDEKISITSSVQDIADVSKAKTDFTQSFTIPASDTNNDIFKHWYESSIDGGFDHRIKYDGYIEIDTMTFRVGSFALNDVKYKNNALDYYSIVFYGKAKSIKDLFKEDKLSNLDFSSLNHSYTPTEVINRITSSSANVAYPLFAHDRIYDYNTGGPNDITTNAGAIKWNSLFPAVKVSKIMDFIETKYGITFTGAFLYYIQFSRLWMLFKNAETLQVKTAPLKVNFTSKTGGTDNEINLTTDEIGFDTSSGGGNRLLRIQIVPTSSVIPYDVLIYKNGVLFNSFTGQLGTTLNTFFNGVLNSQIINDKYTIEIQSETPITWTSTLFYAITNSSGSTTFTASGTSQTTQSVINIGTYAPDIKVIDLFTGLIKMFNLVIIPQDETTYELIPLELYYNNGAYRDISSNVISDDIEIKKTSMYKNINFKYQKSENILNNAFNDLFFTTRNFDYGDLAYEQIDSLESSTFTVELPFENAMYEKEGNFQTVTFKNKDLNNYIPKPLLMYDNGQQNVSPSIRIDLNNGSFTNINSYRRFSNDINNGTLMTLNWGEEISTWFLSSVSNGLYKRHYENYLGNVFNVKSRLLNVKCYFNPVELINIKLNDRIIIRDKRYTINKMTADLTTGETSLELLTDYRVGEVAIGNRFSLEPIYQVDKNAQDLEILLLKNVSKIISLAPSSFAWITYETDIFNDDTTIVVYISENATGLERTGFIGGKWEDELGNVQIIEIPIIQDA